MRPASHTFLNREKLGILGLVVVVLLLGWQLLLPQNSLPFDILNLLPPWSQGATQGATNGLRSDVTTQMFPYRHFLHQEMAQHGIPLWNPYIFCGTPFTGDPNIALFYPTSY